LKLFGIPYIMRSMTETTTHEIIISPAYDRHGERLTGRFNARLGRVVLVRGEVQPFSSSAKALLAAGLAQASDTLVMKRAGSPHELLRSRVAVAAKGRP
jgi:hypothetical protein